jgi:hypothetical protein
LTRKEKRRVYIGVAALVAALFVAGIVAGYVSRNDTICSDGRPPLQQRPDISLGHVVYRCHNGETVTK